MEKPSQTIITPSAGFTLIEFLIYIGITAAILLAATAIGFNVFFGKAKLTAIDEVSQNARFAIQKITQSIRGAESVNSPVKGISAAALSLKTADSSSNPTAFDLSNGTLRIKEGSGPTVDLTSDSVIVTNLLFTNTSYPGAPDAITIQMAIQFKNPNNRQEYNFQQTFYTTTNVYKTP